MPMVQPRPTSTTLRSRGSREKPRAIRDDVAANSGPEWPRMYSAKAYAPTAQTVIWMAGTSELRLRIRPVRNRPRRNRPPAESPAEMAMGSSLFTGVALRPEM